MEKKSVIIEKARELRAILENVVEEWPPGMESDELRVELEMLDLAINEALNRIDQEGGG